MRTFYTRENTGICKVLLLGLFLIVQSNVPAEELKAPAGVDEKEFNAVFSKLRLLQMVVFTSHRAKAVEQSGNTEAIAMLEKAKQNYVQARLLLKDGNLVKSEEEIHKGYDSISKAFKLAVDKVNANLKAKQQYEELLESIKLYRLEYKKLAIEKGVKVTRLLDTEKLASLLEQASELAKEDRYQYAARVLAEVMSMLERTLSKARENETLVYELKFDTPKDEYDYELKRNRNYMAVVDMLLENLPENKKNRLPLINRMVEKNRKLVEKSEQQLKSGKVDEAIITLEEGSKALIKALRLGGLSL